MIIRKKIHSILEKKKICSLLENLQVSLTKVDENIIGLKEDMTGLKGDVAGLKEDMTRGFDKLQGTLNRLDGYFRENISHT